MNSNPYHSGYLWSLFLVQEQVSQTLMEPQTRALVAHAHLDTSAQLAQVSHSHALWALTQTGKLLGSADASFHFPFLFAFSLSPLSNKVQLSKAH